MPRPANPLLALIAGPRSPLQRLRDLLLRPVRHELGDARREIGELRARLADLHDPYAAQPEGRPLLHGPNAALEARLPLAAGERDGLRAELRSLAASLEARRRQGALMERLLIAAQESVPAPTARVEGQPPRVSIVLPTHDRAALVAEAIRSVQAQAFGDWELIVVDDGSNDDTLAHITPFLADARIRVDRIAHAGASAARNHGMQLARGEYFAYLDSDNLWFPGFLSAAVAALDADAGTDLVYGALVTDSHGLAEGCLLLEDFDRPRLLRGNYIDLNTIVHRRALYSSCGGFDESLQRLLDWDLLLRYTANHSARALPVLAARYRACDELRITDNVPAGPNWLAVRKRAEPLAAVARQPRILYVVWHYPQLSETYLEGEIQCMRNWGVEVEVWRTVGPASPIESTVRVHDGELADAVRRFRPDAIHVHWMGFALSQHEALAATGLPVTLRMHGFDVTPRGFTRLLEQPWLHRVYAFPMQLALLPATDARVVPMPAAFDTSLFQPSRQKDRRLVLRAGSCLPSKDIGLLFELAKRFPEHRFVFAGVTCNEFEHFPEELRRLRAQTGSPVELRFDVPRGEMAALMANAGIYLHTINPPEAEFGAPIGMPISIAEAMACGAYVLVRDLPELRAYVGNGGASYADIDEAARLIAATESWSERQWRSALFRASDRSFQHYSDEIVFRPMYEEWCRLATAADAARAGEAATGVVQPA